MYEPRNLTEKDTLFFLHIPKNAGTSMRLFLLNHFSPWDLYESSRESNRQLALFHSGAQLDRVIDIALLSGHYPLKIIKCFKRRPHIVTLLRNPVERILSEFNHRRMDFRIPDDASLDDYLFYSSRSGQLANLQTRWIADHDIEEMIRGFDRETAFDQSARLTPSRLDRLLIEYNDEKILEQALARLEEFAFCGIVEQMNESLRVLCSTFSWPMVHNMTLMNVGEYLKDLSDISESTMQWMKEINKLDFRLYEEVKTRLEKEYSRISEEDSERQTADPVYDMTVNSVFINLGDPIDGENWHGPEKETIGNWREGFRWTGPENPARLIVPVPRNGDIRITFMVLLDEVSRRNVKSVTMKINGKSVGLKLHERIGSALFEGFVPAKTIGEKNPAVLEFSVDKYIRPCDIFQSSDERLLGVRFNWIVLSSVNGPGR